MKEGTIIEENLDFILKNIYYIYSNNYEYIF